jgi:hypothetical protein
MNVLLIALFSLLASCGSDQPDAGSPATETSAQSPSQEQEQPQAAPSSAQSKSVVRKPIQTETEDVSGEEHPRLKGSYIISYKTPSQDPLRSGTYFASHQDEYQFHHQDMVRELGGLTEGQEIENFTLFGTYDMTNQIPLDYEKAIKFRSGMDLTTPIEFVKSKIGVLARVDFRDDADAKHALETWKKSGKLWFSEPNYINELFQNNNPCTNAVPATGNLFAECEGAYTADTDYINDAKAAAEVRAPQAYTALQGRPLKAGRNDDQTLLQFPPIVAVFDSGMDVQHSALNARVFENSAGNIGQTGCDNDQFGCNTTESLKDKLGDGNTFPFGTTGFGQTCPRGITGCSHGTRVASIIAGDGRAGTQGICVTCRVMPIKVTSDIDGEPRILDSSLLAGFRYVSRFRNSATDSAVRAINASLGKYTPNRAVQTMINVLHDQLDIVTVGAAGNEDSNRMSYVAGYSKVLAVAGLLQESHEKSGSSNYGIWVDISAPGDNINAADPGGGTGRADGTSFAAPFVSGAVGLMVARDPDLSADEIRRFIKDSADASIYNNNPLYAPTIQLDGEPTRVALLGRGLLNIEESVKLSTNPNQIREINNERITNFCGIIGAGRSGDKVPYLLLLLIPIFLLAKRKKQKES